MHAACGEVVEPRVVEAVELRRAGAGAAVADPRLGIRRDVLHLAFDDPVVELARPCPHAIERIAAAAVLPVAEELRDPARLEVLGRPAEDRLDEPITDHAAIAVVVFGHVRRCAA